MKLRGGAHEDSAFDGLTAEEVRRIRGAAMANVTPGMEGLARVVLPVTEELREDSKVSQAMKGEPMKRKRGRRA